MLVTVHVMVAVAIIIVEVVVAVECNFLHLRKQVENNRSGDKKVQMFRIREQ